MEIVKTKCDEWKEKMLDGEITMEKTTFWLLLAVILLAGILYGLLTAPMTHGVTIGCNNNCVPEDFFDGDEDEDED